MGTPDIIDGNPGFIEGWGGLTGDGGSSIITRGKPIFGKTWGV